MRHTDKKTEKFLMTTLVRTHKAFINEQGELQYFQFSKTSAQKGHPSNFETVKFMAEKGYQPAVSGLAKLEKMTSRQRSESGIYHKLQHTKEWVEAVSEIIGEKPFTPVTVEFTAEVIKDTPARRRTFMSATFWMNAPEKQEVKALYTGENITIIKKIK